MAVSAQPASAHRSSESEGRLAPGPPGYPVIGVLPDIVRHGSALPVFKDAWRTYGDVVRVPLGPVVFRSRSMRWPITCRRRPQPLEK
jgi:hypothetical protein